MKRVRTVSSSSSSAQPDTKRRRTSSDAADRGVTGGRGGRGGARGGRGGRGGGRGGRPVPPGKYKGTRKHEELVSQSKTLWERIRDQENVRPAERQKLIAELLAMLKGQLMNIIAKHDGSRIVQTCLKHGNGDQRRAIVDELKGRSLELTRMKYAHFLVKSMLKYCSKEQRAVIITQFYGNVCSLVRHKDASEVLEFAFSEVASPLQRCCLLEELYAPEFALFKPEKPRKLAAILKASPEKKEIVVKHMLTLLTALVEKKLVYHSIIQVALALLFDLLDDVQRVDFAAVLSPVAVDIIRSKEGAAAAVKCVSYAGAKQRKIIVRAMKGEVHNVAREEYGHMLLVRLLDVTDDTVLLRKGVISEMLEHLDELATEKHGRLSLLHILVPASTKYFPPNSVAMLQPTTVTGEDGEAKPTSKKDASARRAELLKMVVKPLVEYSSEHAEKMIRDMHGDAVLVALLQLSEEDLGGVDVTPVLAKLVEVIASEEAGEEEEKILNLWFATRAIRRLIKFTDGPGREFAPLLHAALKGKLKRLVAETGSSFVVVSLLEREDLAKEVKAELMPALEDIRNAGEVNPGAKIAHKILSDSK